MSAVGRIGRRVSAAVGLAVTVSATILLSFAALVAPAAAQSTPPSAPAPVTVPAVLSSGGLEGGTVGLPSNDSDGVPALTVDLGGADIRGEGSGPVQVIVLVTLLAIGPAILMLVTAFTRIVIVLGLVRNALNLQGVPPNQVLIGLALFLTIFVMSPVFTKVNDEALQPYLDKQISQQEAFDRGARPVKDFMMKQVREADLALFIDLADGPRPENPNDVPLSTLIPAFVIGELRASFIIGFIVFLPFLIIDLVVSAGLMSMGMVMVQPTTVALPFKLLLFVLVDGWQLLAGSLVRSFVT